MASMLSSPAASSESITVLFVEDVADEREPAIEMLRAHGYDVVEADDGSEAVKHARRSLPDVVMMDVSLPYMNGIEAIRRIRALGGERQPYVIVMSGRLDGRTRQLAFEAGCDEYIVKPCGGRALVAAVRAFLTKRDGRR